MSRYFACVEYKYPFNNFCKPGILLFSIAGSIKYQNASLDVAVFIGAPLVSDVLLAGNIML